MKGTITTYHAVASVARSTEEALRADNRAAPEPLHIRSRARGRRVVSTIAGAQDIESLLATIDDLLLCLIAVDRLGSATRWKGPKTHRKR